MGADKPYHAVRFGQRGLDLELEFGADAQLIADAPLLLAEVLRLREQQRRILSLAEINLGLEWGDTDISLEWQYIIDLIQSPNRR
jgi:hypothetical protein